MGHKYYETRYEDAVMGTGNAGLAAQSYIIWLRNSSWDGSSITFAHRGGYYVKPTEVFGPGILY